jgi:5-methylcytosine-specific restriction endonuclease McrA
MPKRQGEFSTKTKRERLKHAQGKCEASGPLYGLDTGRQCDADLARGVEFDHLVALSIGGDNSLENCLAVCIACHRFKTSKHDLPRAAKTKRQSDKNSGVRRPKGQLKSAGFPKAEKPERTGKAKLPPRPLFRSNAE